MNCQANCDNNATWKQEIGSEIIHICEEHHFILRTKVPNNRELDVKVLEWIKQQPSNHNKVVKFGVTIIGSRTVKGN